MLSILNGLKNRNAGKERDCCEDSGVEE